MEYSSKYESLSQIINENNDTCSKNKAFVLHVYPSKGRKEGKVISMELVVHVDSVQFISSPSAFLCS